MSERARIALELRRSYAGGSWHGPALVELLEGVDHERAAARPVAGAHTIHELALHLRATHELVLRRMRGEPAPFVEAEAWPAPVPGPEGWRATLARLEALRDELQDVLAALEDADLEREVMPGQTLREELDGLVQHDLYHGGQIALLRKTPAGA